MASGQGLGTVDPDWPHFKSMDAILSKEGIRKPELPTSSSMSDDSMLEGPKCEDIKQEVEDVDINDDMSSWQGNDSNGSDYEEEQHIHPAPSPPPPPPPPVRKETPIKPKMPTIIPSFTVPTANQQGIVRAAAPGMPSIPLPLLILNSLQPQQQQQNPNCQDSGKSSTVTSSSTDNRGSTDLNNLLRDLVDVQKQSLEVEREKLEVEKQRLEFDRVVGSQLMTLVPMVGGVLQRLVYPQASTDGDSDGETTSGGGALQDKQSGNRKRPCDDSDYDILKDSKILRTVLERGIKKYMMEENSSDNHKDSDKSDNEEDSGIQNDEDNSYSSTK